MLYFKNKKKSYKIVYSYVPCTKFHSTSSVQMSNAFRMGLARGNGVIQGIGIGVLGKTVYDNSIVDHSLFQTTLIKDIYSIIEDIKSSI